MQDDIAPKLRVLYLDDKYGKFTVEPLERGYGHTLGNAFRRILLAHIPGAAVTNMRINGKLHDFGTLPGVVESTTEIMLNLKEIAVRVDPEQTGDEEIVLRIQAIGPGEVVAGDLEAPPGVEIINPELHIADLAEDGVELEIDVWVERSVGYVPAVEHGRGKHGVDVLPMDTVFSPIRRVNYSVEPVRLGSRTDLDRLVLELWGDGAVRPDEALRIAARELNSYVRLFMEVAEEAMDQAVEAGHRAPVVHEHHDTPIEDVDFSVRTFNCLKKENINTLGELIRRTEEELLAIRHFGKRSLEEVLERLSHYDLELSAARVPEE
jgi:DNA-directed RNA polymerase subunit alpha